MLDPRLYRAAFVPVLLAILVAAFSLENMPRPIGTTLAPDAFDGDRAERELRALARDFPVRRPGDAADERLARRVADGLRALGGGVRLDRFDGETIDGERELVNVVATRPGAPGPGLVVVAHRDAAGRGAEAELSGTVALLELARVFGQGRLRRTITLVATSGGSGGAAGARRLAGMLEPGSADAVLVLGDLAGPQVRKPFVTGFSNGRGQAPLRLRRTVEAALRTEVGTEPGGPRAATQWARLAVPVTTGEQGPFGRDGLPAVLIGVSGERGPDASHRAEPGRLQSFGRGVLRSLYALDGGPDIAPGPEQVVVTRRKVLPGWAVRLLVGALLLPPLLVIVDGFARMRRRREPVLPRVRWTLAGALPFLAAGAFALMLAASGLITAAPRGPVPARAIELDGAAQAGLAGVLLTFVLGWLALRPLALRALVASGRAGTPGSAVAVLLVSILAFVVLWVVNPFAAALFVPAAHLWLMALAPELRIPRALALLLVLAGLVPAAGVALMDARAFALSPLEAAWFTTLLVAGGHVSPAIWILLAVVGGCAVSAVLVAVRRPGRDDEGPPPEVTVRGPATYAGPGSLGGTESALRR